MNNDIKKSPLDEGYQWACDKIGIAYCAQNNAAYLNNLADGIDGLRIAENQLKGNNNPQLHGFAAEIFHEHTYNIDALSKGLKPDARRLASNGLGSIDIMAGGKAASLKYCFSGASSGQHQAQTFATVYNRYIKNILRRDPDATVPTFEEYILQNEPSLSQSGYDIKSITPEMPLYGLQARIIPSDQLPGAIEALKRRIAHDSAIPERAKLVDALKITLEKLSDHLSGPNGEQSMPLSYEDSKVLSTLARQGKFDPKRFDITVASKADRVILGRGILKAGVEAAVMSAIMEMVPDILRLIKEAYNDGIITGDDITESFTHATDKATDSAINGIITAVIQNSCQLGHLGSIIQQASRMANFGAYIGVLVGLTIGIARESIKLSNGEITRTEYLYYVDRQAFMALWAIGGGVAIQSILPAVPVLAFSIGSLLGSLAGGLIFQAREKFLMGLCVEHGYTFWGLVEQDYELPAELVAQLGYDIFEYDDFAYDDFEYDDFAYDDFKYDPFDYDDFEMPILKRGVVGVRKIGYIPQ